MRTLFIFALSLGLAGGPVVGSVDLTCPFFVAAAEARDDGERLQDLFFALDHGPTISGKDFDPREFILLANRFHSLGQSRAFEVFRTYLESRQGKEGKGEETIRLLVLALHEVPPNAEHLPDLGIGNPIPCPRDRKRLPRFPIHFIDDVPFLIVKDYFVLGPRQSVGDYLRLYERKIEWLSGPLDVPYLAEEQAESIIAHIREIPELNGRNAGANTFVLSSVQLQLERYMRETKHPQGQVPSTGR